jgi:hypothetical protein
MSLEWARTRALENRRRERERAQSVQGAEAPEVEMVFPLGVTFWCEKKPPVEVKSDPRRHAHRTLGPPKENVPDLNYAQTSQGNGST